MADEVRRLWEDSGQPFWRLAPPLEPFTTPYPRMGEVSLPLGPDVQETARLLREHGPAITQRFGVTPWVAFGTLVSSSVQRQVSLLGLAQRFIAALD
ncbi:MAG: hypothetical protein HYY02_05945 [Chloroflexi bacterium]|nr:hypothetical protein [Chloroflexota bacterium]